MTFMFLDIQRANADLFFRLTAKGIEAWEKLNALAVDTMRSTLTVAHRDAVGVLPDRRQVQAATDEARSALPSPEKAQSYAHELFEIASDIQAEVANWTQEQIGSQQETMRTWADQLRMVSGSATRAAEQFSGTVRQGVEQASDLAKRGAQDAAAATETMSKTARRAAEHSSSRH
jgi:Phasin protein